MLVFHQLFSKEALVRFGLASLHIVSQPSYGMTRMCLQSLTAEPIVEPLEI